MRIERKNAIAISGGSSPLGMSMLRWAVAKYPRVIALTRTKTEALLELSKRHRIHILEFDLGDEDGIRKAARYFEQHVGRLDALINNASGWHSGGLLLTPSNRIVEQVNASIAGTMLLTQA